MYFVYVLKSVRDQGFYIGKTNNLDRRFHEYNTGHTKSTKSRLPFILLEYHVCADEMSARVLEKRLKSGYMREKLKRKYEGERRGG